MCQSLEYPLDGVSDILLCNIFPQRLVEGNVFGIDAFHTGETRLQEALAVVYPACYEEDGDVASLLQDAHGQFAHQCLPVGGTLAGDDEAGIADGFPEVDGVEQQLYARFAVGVKVLEKGVAQTACRTCSLHAGAVEPEMEC